jgi:hypothetical protein
MKRKRKHGPHLALDLDDILHPSQVFEQPADIVSDLNLSLNEKRAILAAWASDACSVEAAPALRKRPAGRIVEFDEIMDALRLLDQEAYATIRYGKMVRKPACGTAASGRNGEGSQLH